MTGPKRFADDQRSEENHFIVEPKRRKADGGRVSSTSSEGKNSLCDSGGAAVAGGEASLREDGAVSASTAWTGNPVLQEQQVVHEVGGHDSDTCWL